jgi:hypothetical protein
VPTNYFWEVSPSADFSNLLSWRQLDKHRFSATRARILMAQSESGFDYHGPAIGKLNIGPTKREFKFKREQVFTGITSITDSIKAVTTDRILNQLTTKISSGIGASVAGSSFKFGADILTKEEYEVTHSTEQAMSLMTSYSVQQSTSEEHTITLESTDGERVAELRRRYKRIEWDFYLYSCDYLELEYNRRWYWPAIQKKMKTSSSTVLGWPLVRLVFYIPQPDIDITYDDKVNQFVESPDKIEVVALEGKMPGKQPPALDSLERLARLAFPATRGEKKAATIYRRAATKAPAKKDVAKMPVKKAVKKAATKKAAKKAPAKRAVKKSSAKKAFKR